MLWILVPLAIRLIHLIVREASGKNKPPLGDRPQRPVNLDSMIDFRVNQIGWLSNNQRFRLRNIVNERIDKYFSA